MEELASNVAGDRHATKRRRHEEKKTVVRVKIGENIGNMKNEGLPSDLWSWRKYGQKPIKGSPFPRGYYRCSTWKGCSAKKQIERCRTDASLLIVTYSSSHNHPNPNPNAKSQQEQSNPFKPTSLQSRRNAEETKTPLVFKEEPVPFDPTPFSAIESESMGNDFFDELEELPMSKRFLEAHAKRRRFR